MLNHSDVFLSILFYFFPIIIGANSTHLLARKSEFLQTDRERACLQNECPQNGNVTQCHSDCNCNRHITGQGFYQNGSLICRNATNSHGIIIFDNLNMFYSMVCYDLMVSLFCLADDCAPRDGFSMNFVYPTFIWNKHTLNCSLSNLTSFTNNQNIYFSFDIHQEDSAEQPGMIALHFPKHVNAEQMPSFAVCVDQPASMDGDCKRKEIFCQKDDPELHVTTLRINATVHNEGNKNKEAEAAADAFRYNYCFAKFV